MKISKLLILFMLPIKVFGNDVNNKFIEDFKFYYLTLVETHPFANEILSKEDYDNSIKKLQNCNSNLELLLIIQNLNSKLKDAHTSLLNQKNLDYKEKYPISFIFINHKLVLKGVPLIEYKNFIGNDIDSINSYSVNEIKKIFSDYISYENEIGLENNIVHLLRIPELLFLLNIVKDDKKLSIHFSNNEKMELYPNNNLNIKYNLPSIPCNKITCRSNRNFYYMINDSLNLCYLQLNSLIDKVTFKYISSQTSGFKKLFYYFHSRKYESFSKYLIKMFNEVEQKKVKTIVIDLRYNGGGNSVLGDQLLEFLKKSDTIQNLSEKLKISDLYKKNYKSQFTYFQRQNRTILENKLYDLDELEKKSKTNLTDDNNSPFYIDPSKIKKFKGEVYFIQSRYTFSSALDLMIKISDNKLFPIIGEESSQKPCRCGDILSIKLPNSKLECNISYKYFIRPDKSLCNSDYLYPNFQISLTNDDYKNNKDVWWDFIIKEKLKK